MSTKKTLNYVFEQQSSSSGEYSDKQSEYLIPQNQQRNKYNSIRAKRLRRKLNQLLYNQSKWNLRENILYKEFLKQNQNLFGEDQFKARKQAKINVMMSHYVRTRSSDQCRSHHQKMRKNHRSIPSIIQRIEELQNQFVEPKIHRRQSSSLQQESVSVERPRVVSQIIVNLDQKSEKQQTWEPFENQSWLDYLQL